MCYHQPYIQPIIPIRGYHHNFLLYGRYNKVKAESKIDIRWYMEILQYISMDFLNYALNIMRLREIETGEAAPNMIDKYT